MPEPEPPSPESEASVSPETLQVLVDNHRRFLVFLEKRVGNRALAEDILQDAFVRGMGKLDSLREAESVVAWFFRMLRNAVTDQHRRSSAHHKKLAAFSHEIAESVPPDAELRASVCSCVGQLAGTLKPEYAEVLRRVEVDGLLVKDWASEAGIHSNNAAVRLFRAREALRRRVLQACGTCAEHGCFDCTCESSAVSRGCGSE